MSILKVILDKITNYDPDAATSAKVSNFNDILVAIFSYLEEFLGL